MSGPSLKVINGLGGGGDKPPGAISLSASVYERARDCVRCGLCLPACPTYTTNGLESDSPRGRIALIKGLADGNVSPTEAVVRHLDLCLDCRACETACPSGVVYHELIESARPQLEAHRRVTWRDRLVRVMVRHVFAYPRRMRGALWPATVLRRLGLWRLAASMPMAALLPPRVPRAESLAGLHRAIGPRKTTVGFFTGCVGSVLFGDVNRQAVELLRHAGADVLVPDTQVCCGAIHHHSGDPRTAEAFARTNLAAFAGKVDAVVTAVAGCGAMLQDYPHLVGEDKCNGWTVKDITVALDELGLPPPRCAMQLTATYHDACHLAHAQRVIDAPRRLLSLIDGLHLVPLAESDMCCGAAGTYNLTQPVMARELGARKLARIRATGAAVCVTANAGCALQIAAVARSQGVELDVVHPVTLLHRAVVGG